MASTPTGAYQAVCGHYLQSGVYACRECNIAPLSELLEARAEIKRLGKAEGAFLAEIKRLQADNAELNQECDQWVKKQAASWAALGRLRAALGLQPQPASGDAPAP